MRSGNQGLMFEEATLTAVLKWRSTVSTCRDTKSMRCSASVMIAGDDGEKVFKKEEMCRDEDVLILVMVVVQGSR